MAGFYSEDAMIGDDDQVRRLRDRGLWQWGELVVSMTVLIGSFAVKKSQKYSRQSYKKRLSDHSESFYVYS